MAATRKSMSFSSRATPPSSHGVVQSAKNMGLHELVALLREQNKISAKTAASVAALAKSSANLKGGKDADLATALAKKMGMAGAQGKALAADARRLSVAGKDPSKVFAKYVEEATQRTQNKGRFAGAPYKPLAFGEVPAIKNLAKEMSKLRMASAAAMTPRRQGARLADDHLLRDRGFKEAEIKRIRRKHFRSQEEIAAEKRSKRDYRNSQRSAHSKASRMGPPQNVRQTVSPALVGPIQQRINAANRVGPVQRKINTAAAKQEDNRRRTAAGILKDKRDEAKIDKAAVKRSANLLKNHGKYAKEVARLNKLKLRAGKLTDKQSQKLKAYTGLLRESTAIRALSGPGRVRRGAEGAIGGLSGKLGGAGFFTNNRSSIIRGAGLGISKAGAGIGGAVAAGGVGATLGATALGGGVAVAGLSHIGALGKNAKDMVDGLGGAVVSSGKIMGKYMVANLVTFGKFNDILRGTIGLLVKIGSTSARELNRSRELMMMDEKIIGTRFGVKKTPAIMDAIASSANKYGMSQSQARERIKIASQMAGVKNTLISPNSGDVNPEAFDKVIRLMKTIELTQPDIQARIGMMLPNILGGDARSFAHGFETTPEAMKKNALDIIAKRMKETVDELKKATGARKKTLEETLRRDKKAQSGLAAATFSKAPGSAGKNLDFLARTTEQVYLSAQGLEEMAKMWSSQMKIIGGAKEVILSKSIGEGKDGRDPYGRLMEFFYQNVTEKIAQFAQFGDMSKIREVMDSLVDGVINFFDGVIGNISSVLNDSDTTFGDKVGGILSAIFDGIEETTRSLVSGDKSVVSNQLQSLGLGKESSDAIAGKFAGLGEIVGNLTSDFANLAMSLDQFGAGLKDSYLGKKMGMKQQIGDNDAERSSHLMGQRFVGGLRSLQNQYKEKDPLHMLNLLRTAKGDEREQMLGHFKMPGGLDKKAKARLIRSMSNDFLGAQSARTPFEDMDKQIHKSFSGIFSLPYNSKADDATAKTLGDMLLSRTGGGKSNTSGSFIASLKKEERAKKAQDALREYNLYNTLDSEGRSAVSTPQRKAARGQIEGAFKSLSRKEFQDLKRMAIGSKQSGGLGMFTDKETGKVNMGAHALPEMMRDKKFMTQSSAVGAQAVLGEMQRMFDTGEAARLTEQGIRSRGDTSKTARPYASTIKNSAFGDKRYVDMMNGAAGGAMQVDKVVQQGVDITVHFGEAQITFVDGRPTKKKIKLKPRHSLRQRGNSKGLQSLENKGKRSWRDKQREREDVNSRLAADVSRRDALQDALDSGNYLR